MQRKRGDLVPIAKALADLSGPVKAIRNATPQSLHHFTLADQVDRLVAAAVPVQAQVDCADWNSKEYSGRRWLRI